MLKCIKIKLYITYVYIGFFISWINNTQSAHECTVADWPGYQLACPVASGPLMKWAPSDIRQDVKNVNDLLIAWKYYRSSVIFCFLVPLLIDHTFHSQAGVLRESRAIFKLLQMKI